MNPLDPYSWDPYARLAAPPRPQAPQMPPLSPQEESSILGRVGNATLGGIGYAGEILEKSLGGRAVRGLLGGKPRELLSIIPGSDLTGITDINDRVSGQELLGLKGNDDWGSILAGIGTEIATDPATYLTFGAGAIGEAGSVASKLGMLPKTMAGRAGGTLGKLLTGATPEVLAAAETAAGPGKLAALMDKPLGGLAGIGLPFQKPSVLLGAGQGGVDFLQGAGKLASGADALARSVPFVGPQYGHAADLASKAYDAGGRYLGAAFNPANLGDPSGLGQKFAQPAYAAGRALETKGNEALLPMLTDLNNAGVERTGQVLRGAIEGTHAPQVAGSLEPTTAEVALRLQKFNEERRAMHLAEGLPDPMLVDPAGTGYAARSGGPLERTGAGGAKGSHPWQPEMKGRDPLFKGFPQGTAGIEAMAADPEVYQAGTPLEAAALIRQKYLLPFTPAGDRPVLAAVPDLLPGASAQEVAAHANALKAAQYDHSLALAEHARVAAEAKRVMDQSTGLADMVRNDAQRRAAVEAGNLPPRMFPNHPIVDALESNRATAPLLARARGVRDLLASVAHLPGEGGGTEKLLDVMEKVGLSGPNRDLAAVDALNRAGQGHLASELSNLMVSPEGVASATRFMRPFSAPEYVSTPLSYLDKLTNWFKALQTSPWPAFNVRNLFSGQVQNVNEGVGLGNLPVAHGLQAGKLIPGAENIPHLAQGLTTEQATEKLALEYAARLGHLGHQGAEGVGPLGTPIRLGRNLDEALADIPGQKPQTIWGAAKNYFGGGPDTSWMPGASPETLPPVAAGRKIGNVVENDNRLSQFIGLRQQGYTADAAAERVLGTHFDYTAGAKTGFEKQVISRLMPFYTYQKGITGYVGKNLLEHPGGIYGTGAKVAADLRQHGGFLPDYLGSGLAVPLGSETDGTQRDLTRLDTPPEQAFEWLKDSPQKTLMGLLGQTNPLLKGPLEYATGKQFYSGRDVGDLYNLTGSSTLDQVLMNSPLSRAATTVRTLADERKWQDPAQALSIPLNLATGARVSDVDVGKARDQAARDYIKEQLGNLPEFGKFESLYLRPGMEDLLTPQERDLYRLQKNLQQRAQQKAKQK